MLRPGVTQEWVDEGELPRKRTKNRRWKRPYDVLAEATHGEVVVRRQAFHMYASKLASDERLGHQLMGAVYHQGRSQIVSTSESHGGDLIIQRYDRSDWRVRLLQCSHSLKEARQVRGQSRECSTKERSRQYVVLYLFYSEEQAAKVMEKTVQSHRRPDLSKTYSKLGDSKLG
ncbi:hypothetical protein BHM03_00031840 [Ensete ventricosum]|nr:hypothetical protein BHM03_00031840 [Ensete ventricosum]